MQFLRNFVILFLCFISAKDCFAQGETSNWYFGENAGIRFNNDGSVIPLNNGRLNTREGCAAISDSFGNLLFYTDGVTVWNRNHQVMEDGHGLYGDPSSSQSAIIVPQPGDPDLYYIFTVDTAINIDDPNRGLNYSVVDITMNNGNGAVIQKNANLLNRCSEKLSAVVKDCFDGTIWVTTFAGANGNSDIFNTLFSFEVSSSGVNTTPVTSNSPVPRVDPDRSDPRGYLKISPDGTKVAMANVKDGLYLYDFDVNTGIFSNMQKLSVNALNEYPYGLEFSQNNQFLYVSTYNDLPINEVNANHQSSLIQYNLSATNVGSSQIILEEFNNVYRSALQLGSNGKIYMTLSEDYNTGTPYLSAINNPDLSGTASGYEHQAINLGSNRATQGLPPFIQSLFNKIDIINGPDATTLSPTSILNLCIGDSYTLMGENIPGATYVWTKDGIPLPDTDHDFFLNDVTSVDVGLYELEITTIEGDCPIIGEAAINVSDFPTPDNAALIQCDAFEDMTDGITVFNLYDATNAINGGDESLLITFYENTDDYTNDLPISDPESYINNTVSTILVKVTNTGGCSTLANLDLIVTQTALVPAATPYYFNCDEDPKDNILQAYFDFEVIRNDFTGLNTEFYSNLNNLSYEDSMLSGNLLLENNTIVYVKIKDTDGNCLGIETFTLFVDEKPDLPPFQNIPFVCLNNPGTSITGPEGYDAYSWFYINGNGSETPVSSEQNPIITQPGNYRLEVSYSYNDFGTSRTCSTFQTFIVPASNIATITPLPEVNDISNTNSSTNSLNIFTEGEGDYEFALNNINGPYQDNNTFENVPAGFHSVHVRDKNGCGTVSVEDITVIGYPRFFTPNNDNVNDFWNIEGISELLQQNTEIHIFNRYGKLLTRIIPGTQGWDGTLNGQPLPSTDYWFSAELEDGRNFKGHFTLKR